MANEFIYLVLDIGSRYIRGGVAGEELPQVTLVNGGYNHNDTESIASNKSSPPYLQLNDHALSGTQYEEITSKLNDSVKHVIRYFQADCEKWLDWNQQDYDLRLHEHLLDFFNHFPLDLSMCKLIVLDGKLSLIDKYKLSRILLTRIGVKSLQFIPCSILSVISSRELNGNGLLIDISWSTFKVTPVVDFRILGGYEDNTIMTGMNLHYRILEELIKLDHPVVTDANSFDIIEQFILNHIYCGSSLDNNEVNVGGYDFPHHLRNGVTNSMALDIIDPIVEMLNGDYEIDTIKVLQQNIIFDGGVSKIPGFKSRVLQLLRERTSLHVRANLCLGSWQGGSIYCSTSLLRRSRSIRKTEELTKETIKTISSDKGVQLTKVPDVLNYYKVVI